MPQILIYLFIPKNIRKNVNQLLSHNSSLSPYSLHKKNQMGEVFTFSPHPFTNWSLNPAYKNKHDQFVHTIEGFRKTNTEDSIIETLKNNEKSYKIVCIGGSSTHCQEMDNYEDTWPAKLQNELKQKNVLVINFAVGAWTTLHSLIRCVNWLPKIKPNLLIFYHAKNDLTPLANSSINEKIIYSDYQNIIGQYGENLLTKFPKFLSYIPLFYAFFYFFIYKRKFKQYGLHLIYRPEPKYNSKGLERLSDDYLENIIFRKEVILMMCKKIGCKVLYIPEIFKKNNTRLDKYADLLSGKIFPRIRDLVKNYDNLRYEDINKKIPNDKKYFIDNLHFTKEGNELISKEISQIIKDKYLSQ